MPLEARFFCMGCQNSTKTSDGPKLALFYNSLTRKESQILTNKTTTFSSLFIPFVNFSTFFINFLLLLFIMNLQFRISSARGVSPDQKVLSTPTKTDNRNQVLLGPKIITSELRHYSRSHRNVLSPNLFWGETGDQYLLRHIRNTAAEEAEQSDVIVATESKEGSRENKRLG